MDITEKEKETLIELGFKDETINKCINFEDLLRQAMDPELKEKVKDCFSHRLFSH